MTVLPSRNTTDTLADAVISAYFDAEKRSFPIPLSSNQQFWAESKNANKLIFEMINSPHNELLQIKVAAIFSKYEKEIFFILGFYSLPYCYAAARGARVLVLSKQIVENPEKRFIETAQFVKEICQSNSFDKTGKGLAYIYNVRIMHAAARFFASKQITDEVPLNQQDMVGTLLSFSLLVIRGLSKLGIELSTKEKQTWMLHWCYVGKLLGIPNEYLPISLKIATEQEYAIRKSEFGRSKEGLQLVKSLLYFMKSEKLPIPFEPEKMIACFLGKEVASHLDLATSQAECDWMIFQARLLMNSEFAEYLSSKNKLGSYPNVNYEFPAYTISRIN